MAEASFFETGRLTDVWTVAGRDAGGALRYRRAPYDLLLWQPASANVAENYVVPLGIERVNSADVVLKADGSPQIGQEFGYYSGDWVVIDPSSGDGMSDTLQALHSFGPV